MRTVTLLINSCQENMHPPLEGAPCPFLDTDAADLQCGHPEMLCKHGEVSVPEIGVSRKCPLKKARGK